MLDRIARWRSSGRGLRRRLEALPVDAGAPPMPEHEGDVERGRLIEEIHALAPGAHGALLMRFSAPALALFRDHLLCAHLPRGPESRWERPGDTPAVVVYEPTD